MLNSTLALLFTWWPQPTTHIDQKALTLLFSVLCVSFLFLIFKKSKNPNPPLPPGPRGLPLLGYLPFLGTHLHRTFANLAKTYGPIYKLWLGNKMYLVISSPEVAKQVLRDQDAVFANRDPTIGAMAISYGAINITFSNNGPHWRKMRRIFVGEILSNANLHACYHLRRLEVRKALLKTRELAGSRVDVGELMFVTVTNAVISMLVGGSGKESDKNSAIASKIRVVVAELMVLLGKPNISDLFPVLARFDLQGVEKQSKKVTRSCEEMIDSLMEYRIKSGHGADKEKTKKDFLQILMELRDSQDSEKSITTTQFKALLIDYVVGGTDTTSATAEWVMAELMKHPEMMDKVQQELTKVVGLDNLVEESHLPKLVYLDAVVKETFRLHPALPLLVPHCPYKSCIVGGYTVPENTRVFLNVWAIQRDPELWDNPLKFQPERFLDDSCKVDYSGNNFKFFPFGSGRRVCAGLSLAERMLLLSLASFLHSFEWKLPEGEDLDLSDKFGIVIKKMKPLIAIPTPRLPNFDL